MGMSPRYPAAVALTLMILIAAPGVAAKGVRHRRHPAATPPPRASDLYSARALRRARIILQLKLMELRAERLERVRKAIEKNVPIDDILKTNVRR